MTHQKRLLRLLLAFAVVVMPWGLLGLAEAGFVTIDLGQTPYQISYNADPAKVKVIDISFPPNGGNLAVLTKNVKFLTNDPFIIKFTEKTPPQDYSATSGGFKVSLSLNLINGTDKDWVGFTETLRDFDFQGVQSRELDGMTRGSTTHPLGAHFHPKDLDPEKFISNPFRQGGFASGDGVDTFTVTGGTVQKGDLNSWTASSFFIHAMEIKGLPRTFSLIEQPIPVPEPTSITLLGIGIFVLLGYTRRHHRGATVERAGGTGGDGTLADKPPVAPR